MANSSTAPGTFHLILVPTILTLVASGLRLYGQVEGWFSTKSGGGGEILGVTSLGVVCSLWFAFRLRRTGSSPRVGKPWLWSLLALAPVVVAFALTAPKLMEQEANDAGYAVLRTAALAAVASGCVAAFVQFAVWPRLAWTLLCYAVPARLSVVAMTWLAKHNGWDTHYTKFGPKGWTFDMEGTMTRATLMQLGFWVPFTIITGTLLGVVLFGRGKKA